MTGTPLFIVEPTGACRLSLRRFRHREDTSGHFHDVSVVIAEDAPSSPAGTGRRKQPTELRIANDDPRWPARCPCGEPFGVDDRWQVNELDWYEGGGQRFAWGIGSWDGPAGAVMRAAWRDIDGRPPAWQICLPNQTWWNTNDRAAGSGNGFGPYWEVTGEAPALTVSPSINDTSSRPWHGWIRNGFLVDA